MSAIVVPTLALIWAGVALGGSLIAAPAKFQAPSLDLPTALEVGRAQFSWIGIAEAALCAAIVLGLLIGRPAQWLWVAVPIGLFAVQHLVVMPPLDARTVAVIGGAMPGETHLHLVFIVLEVAKVLALVAAAILMLRVLPQSS